MILDGSSPAPLVDGPRYTHPELYPASSLLDSKAYSISDTPRSSLQLCATLGSNRSFTRSPCLCMSRLWE